jgi:hypothetical protein
MTETDPLFRIGGNIVFFHDDGAGLLLSQQCCHEANMVGYPTKSSLDSGHLRPPLP